jgi:YHS domain-containing protein
MMKRAAATLLTVFMIASVTRGANEHENHQHKTDKANATAQTTCPVMGGKINKELFVDHGGKRVFVCCKGCIDPVRKDPQKFIAKLETSGVTLMKLQTSCPVMGGKINKELYVDHDGKRVYVCCKSCINALKKDPEKYIEKLELEGVSVAMLQTTCPVMGGKINTDLYVDYDGKRIFVCCKGCVSKVAKDAEKYARKLEGSGVVLERTTK